MVAVVTGAASGIGKATASRLASEGAAVACLDVQEEANEAVASSLDGATATTCNVRDLASIEQAVAAGVARIVLGTTELEQPELVAEACARYPGRVVVALDARNGKVTTHGWQQESAVDMFDLAHQMVEVGVSRFLYTDVERDGTLSQPNFAATGALAQAVPVPVIASGGVASLEHLARLTTLGVEGAIVGIALYRGAFTLPEALAAVQDALT